MSSTSAASFYKNTKSHTVFSHNILICQYNGGSVVYIYILNILKSFPVCAFVRLLVRGIKNGHLIGRRNEVTANMAALAVYMCFAASRLLDTLRASGWVSKARRTLAQKLTVIIWCEGAALAISTGVFLFRFWVL